MKRPLSPEKQWFDFLSAGDRASLDGVVEVLGGAGCEPQETVDPNYFRVHLLPGFTFTTIQIVQILTHVRNFIVYPTHVDFYLGPTNELAQLEQEVACRREDNAAAPLRVKPQLHAPPEIMKKLSYATVQMARLLNIGEEDRCHEYMGAIGEFGVVAEVNVCLGTEMKLLIASGNVSVAVDGKKVQVRMHI
jgi:hypothetical protein